MIFMMMKELEFMVKIKIISLIYFKFLLLKKKKMKMMKV